MEDWIDAETLMRHWQIDAPRLLELIKAGLEPHDVLGRPALPPSVSHKISLKIQRQQQLQRNLERLERLRSDEYQDEITQRRRAFLLAGPTYPVMSEYRISFCQDPAECQPVLVT